MITTNFKETKANVLTLLKANLVPFIQSSPGEGKSSLVFEISQEHKKFMIDHRLSTGMPEDQTGLPKIENNKSKHYPFDIFPIESDPIPEGYTGWIIFLDEFNSAHIDVQKSAYKLILDRMVGQYKLHPKVRIICAGNMSNDNALVSSLSTAMQSRLVHIYFKPTVEEWLEYVVSKLYDPRIIGYINFKPSSLNTFNPNHDDVTFACQRTWEFVNKQLQVNSEPNLALLCGTIGEAEGRQFYAFCDIYKNIPTLKEILANPKGITIPDELSTVYAISSMLIENLNETNIEKALPFIERMPIELVLVTLKMLGKKNSKILEVKSVKDCWIKVGGELL